MAVTDSDIAIIGMACRFPQADTVEAFWEVLREGRETLTRYSDEQLLASGVAAQDLADPSYIKAGQSIAGTDLFDAELFRYTRDEAEILDPQHRIFLECALEAIERAGYDPKRSTAHIGVYAGAGMSSYLLHNLGERYRQGSSIDRYRMMLANDKDYLATRVSYKLDLRGPSININTACSTSLVAVHTACLALLAGECDLALVGAVHLGQPEHGYHHHDGMIFSPDGHCRAFDAGARGTVVGSGAGAVILKRLPEALADGDSIHAVIKGSAVNNDGSAKTGYTAPSIAGQAAVIADAHEVAGVEPDAISYVEAHGTGTPLGDPIEVAALTQAFRQSTSRRGFCALGSVKTNIGHLDTAAGMAGLIKTALMLEHGTLVPSLHYAVPNPEIDFEASPFFVSTETTAWPPGPSPRTAGVSSFGMGGTNAHVILEEPPAQPPAPQQRGTELLVLSARSEAALEKATTALARHLRSHPGLSLAAVAATLAVGRREHTHRLALTATSTRDAAMALALRDKSRLRRGAAAPDPDTPALVLTGSCPEDSARAELYSSVPAYRAAADACSAAASRAGCNSDLLGEGSTLAAFTHEYALATTLIAWGLAPTALAATGTGLAAAAALADALPLAEALDLAAGTRPGSMRTPHLPVVSPRSGQWMTQTEAADPATWQAGAPLPNLEGLFASEHMSPVHLAPAASTSGLSHLLTLVAQQWIRGVPLDLEAVTTGEGTRRIPLPTHCFERNRYWIAPVEPVAGHPLDAGRPTEQVTPDEPRHTTELITRHLIEQIGTMIGNQDAVGLDDSVFDLGLDSLMLIEIVAKLSDELGIDIATSAFTVFPTIRSFVDHIVELMAPTADFRAGADQPRQPPAL